MNRDPYEVLGVTPDTPKQEIKKQYRKLVKMYHPDLHPGDELAAAKMDEINAAYDILQKPHLARYATASAHRTYEEEQQSSGRAQKSHENTAYEYGNYGRAYQSQSTAESTYQKTGTDDYSSADAYAGNDYYNSEDDEQTNRGRFHFGFSFMRKEETTGEKWREYWRQNGYSNSRRSIFDPEFIVNNLFKIVVIISIISSLLDALFK